MVLIEIAKDDWEKVPLIFEGTSLLVEVVSNRRIDFGVVDETGLLAFERDEEDFNNVVWFENQSGPREFPVDAPPEAKKYWLILWNANEDKKACVCYRFSRPI
jgi:hypothetical protein